MNTILRLIGLIICLLPLDGLSAQDLTFISSTHNFGAVAEDGGVVSTTFTYTNSGSSPVVIVTASSSCGCTTPNYSRKPIMPGESSTLQVDFDPMGRPGIFTKTVEIILAPSNDKYTLTIEGEVTPREKSTEELYPFDMGGGFRIEANYYPLSYVEQGRRVETQVSYINTSKREVSLSLKAAKSSSLLFIDLPEVIAAGQSGSFAVGYNLDKGRGSYGALSDRLEVSINGKRSKYDLIFNGHAVDSFTPEQRATPPICNIGSRLIRLGEVKKGKESSKYKFVIENSGVSDLVVRNVAADDNLNTTIIDGEVISPGSLREFEVWINTKTMEHGAFSRYLTLTLNDPDVPVQRVRVAGIVVE